MKTDLPKATFTKDERLSSKKEIDWLFEEGKSFIAYPLRVVFYILPKEENQENVSILVNVSKRKFKRAVHRNHIKRLIREIYRINKHDLKNKMEQEEKRLIVAFLYLENTIQAYPEIEKAMKKALNLLIEKQS